MTALRDIWVDLVDKRLWPVAAVLLAAVVAVPLVLAKPAPKKTVAIRPANATAPAPGQSMPGGDLISDVSGTAYVGPVTGATKDPFRPQHLPPRASSGSSVASATGTAGAASPASSGSGSSAPKPSGGSGSSGSSGPSKPRAPTQDVAAVEFGVAGKRAAKRNVPELTPLPSATSPVVVYLGQASDGRAGFLVSSDATPTGRGRCLPNRKVCSTLLLAPGQVEYLRVATREGRTIRYRLKFVRAVEG